MSLPCLTLWYIVKPYSYDSKHFTDNVWQPSWYHRVLRLPVCEMLSNTPAELAVELVRMSGDDTWVQRYKRPMRLGDRFTLDAVNWIFTPVRDAVVLTTAGLLTLKINTLTDTTITQVTGPP